MYSGQSTKPMCSELSHWTSVACGGSSILDGCMTICQKWCPMHNWMITTFLQYTVTTSFTVCAHWISGEAPLGDWAPPGSSPHWSSGEDPLVTALHLAQAQTWALEKTPWWLGSTLLKPTLELWRRPPGDCAPPGSTTSASTGGNRCSSEFTFLVDWLIE